MCENYRGVSDEKEKTERVESFSVEDKDVYGLGFRNNNGN